MLVLLHLIRKLEIIIASTSTTRAITAFCIQSHVVQRVMVPVAGNPRRAWALVMKTYQMAVCVTVAVAAAATTVVQTVLYENDRALPLLEQAEELLTQRRRTLGNSS
jgi:uncharacterized membrane protein